MLPITVIFIGIRFKLVSLGSGYHYSGKPQRQFLALAVSVAEFDSYIFLNLALLSHRVESDLDLSLLARFERFARILRRRAAAIGLDPYRTSGVDQHGA